MEVISNVLDGQWKNLQADIEKSVAQKIMNRVNDKKIDFLAKINGISADQMKETIAVTQE